MQNLLKQAENVGVSVTDKLPATIGMNQWFVLCCRSVVISTDCDLVVVWFVTGVVVVSGGIWW